MINRSGEPAPFERPLTDAESTTAGLEPSEVESDLGSSGVYHDPTSEHGIISPQCGGHDTKIPEYLRDTEHIRPMHTSGMFRLLRIDGPWTQPPNPPL